MGQEASQPVLPDTPPRTLSDRSLAAVADLIRSGRAKRIVVMTGAGISTAAGIPDFRSPKTGLYHNLARLNLPHPEAVFDIDFFREDPRPFYVLAKELYPGNFQPTVSHAFIALLARKGLLRMLFTQNIDCLERAAGVPPELIIEAHGSFATQRCIECKTPFPDDAMRAHVERGDPPSCPREGCDGLVKPDIVFFGERLPDAFYEGSSIAAQADLVLVMGTSLTVHPFAGLPRLAPEPVPRVLLNRECVGDLGTRADDVLRLGTCDAGVRDLADALGWRGELESAWEEVVGKEEAQRQRRGAIVEEDEMRRLAERVETKLEISDTTAKAADDDEAANDCGDKQAPGTAARGGTKADTGPGPEEGVEGCKEGDAGKEGEEEEKAGRKDGAREGTATETETAAATTTGKGAEEGSDARVANADAEADTTTDAPAPAPNSSIDANPEIAGHEKREKVGGSGGGSPEEKGQKV
ncbi:DHS-like NAD/FAD-binding domain-containing protein [Camillea tinctor]|nr:DHS-like NAD/FAD-binding domain-containing protein [Camillea tinctor]